MKMNKKSLIIPAFLLIASLGISATASANDSVTASVGLKTPVISVNAHDSIASEPSEGKNMHMGDDMRNGMRAIFGTVSAVNGSTITVSSKSMVKDSSTIPVTTTYTVNTTSSTVVDKNTATSAVSAITVGDTVMIEGTVTGTTVTATKIHDGIMAKGVVKKMDNKDEISVLEGNGQPIIGGTVTAVSGNTVTITNKSNVAYTVDVTNAKITKSGTVAAASNIAVGDELIAQGTINGNSVAAVNVVDSAKISSNVNGKGHSGFLGAIGSFFSRIFGFGK